MVHLSNRQIFFVTNQDFLRIRRSNGCHVSVMLYVNNPLTISKDRNTLTWNSPKKLSVPLPCLWFMLIFSTKKSSLVTFGCFLQHCPFLSLLSSSCQCKLITSFFNFQHKQSRQKYLAKAINPVQRVLAQHQ